MAGNAGRWGWHQLDKRWAARLVESADVRPGDLVVDVGAGAGVITTQLLRAGASVVAVELHPRRVSLLRDQFAKRPVIVVRADAADLRLPRRSFKVVANPPFGVTTALLRRLTANDHAETNHGIELFRLSRLQSTQRDLESPRHAKRLRSHPRPGRRSAHRG